MVLKKIKTRTSSASRELDLFPSDPSSESPLFLHTQTHTHTDTHTQTHTDTHTDTHRHTQTQKITEINN